MHAHTHIYGSSKLFIPTVRKELVFSLLFDSFHVALILEVNLFSCVTAFFLSKFFSPLAFSVEKCIKL